MKESEIGVNAHEKTLLLFHMHLKPVYPGSYKVVCPFCSEGVFLVRRNEDMSLSKYDNCIACGQRVMWRDASVEGQVFK